jgi:hypothetical protein
VGVVYKRKVRFCTTCHRRLDTTAARLACGTAGHVVEIREQRVWWIRYAVNGRCHTESSFSQDRQVAENLLQARERGSAVVEPTPAAAPSAPPLVTGGLLFDESADDLILDYMMNRKRSLGTLKGRINLHLRPVFGGLRQGIIDARRLTNVRDDAWLALLSLPPRATANVEGLRRVLHAVRTECLAADEAVLVTAATDPVATAWQKIVGIGPVLALTIRAEVGDIRRFPTAAHLASYAGLVPRVEASAGRVYHGSITRRGSPWLRWALVEVAMHAHRRQDRTGRWVRRLAVRKGALTARVAAARRICVDVFERWPAGAHV